jgi:hypothetical protein
LWIFSDSSAVTLAEHIKKYDRPMAPKSLSPAKPQLKSAKGKKPILLKSFVGKAAAKTAEVVPCHIQPDFTKCWKLESKGLEECKSLAATFLASSHDCEKELGEIIQSDVIKAVERRLAEHELKRKREARIKKELELSAAAAASRPVRERKKINYSDDAFNILDAAVEVEKKSSRKNLVDEECAGFGSGGRPTRNAAKNAVQLLKSISAWDKHGDAVIDDAVDVERRGKNSRSNISSNSSDDAVDESDYTGSSSSGSSSSSISDSSYGSDSDVPRRRKRQDASKYASTAKTRAKDVKVTAKQPFKRRNSGLPPIPRVKSMYEPAFAAGADISAVIAAIEDMPLHSGREDNATLPSFKVARFLGNRGTAGPAADHLPRAELVRDTLLWLHELQEKFGITVPSTPARIHASAFEFGQWCLIEADYYHMTPVIRQYILDFWREQQFDEDQLQLNALSTHRDAVDCDDSPQQQQTRPKQITCDSEDRSGCDELQNILQRK